MGYNRLSRSSSSKVVAGVCGGIAEYYGWDASTVRIIYILVSVFSAGFPGTIVYIILWILMPED